MSVLGRNVREDRSAFAGNGGGGQGVRAGEAVRGGDAGVRQVGADQIGVEMVVSWRLFSVCGGVSGGATRLLEWRIGARWARAVVVEGGGAGGSERVVVERATVSRVVVEGLTHITVAEGHDAAALLTVVLDGASVLYGRTSVLTSLGVVGGGAEGPMVRV